MSSPTGDAIKAAITAIVPASDKYDFNTVWEEIGKVLDLYTFSYQHFDVDISGIVDYNQSSLKRIQHYSVTTGIASNDFNLMAGILQTSGSRVRIEKVDKGAGIGWIVPNGAEAFVGGATAFPLRQSGDFIEYEVHGNLLYVIDSLSTLDSAALNTPVQNLAHGIAVLPRKRPYSFVCLSADQNWAAGEELDAISNFYDGPNRRWWTVGGNATNLTISREGDLLFNNKATGAGVVMDPTKWKLRWRYSI